MARGGNKRTAPSSPAITAAIRNSRSNTSSGLSTPTTETPPKVATREPIKLNTNVPSVVVDPTLLNRLSPSVRDVAEHAAVLKSVLARLGPIYDLVERESCRMTEVSPFLAGKDQVDEARNRLAAEAQKREEKIRAIKGMIEAEKQKFVASINGRLENMIRDIVVTKVKERVKSQVAELLQPYHKVLQGNKGRTLRSKMFLSNIEAKSQNATIRSRFPKERITPIYRPISVEFQIQQSVTSSPIVGPVGGYNPSPSAKFPETFGALIKLPLSDSKDLLKEYGLEAATSDKKNYEEARLDNLNELMSHFGIGYRLHPGPAKKGPIVTSLWDRR